MFGDTQLSYTRPDTRLTGHLAGYDPAAAPKFVWPERLAAAKREIRRQAEARGAPRPNASHRGQLGSRGQAGRRAGRRINLAQASAAALLPQRCQRAPSERCRPSTIITASGK